MKALEKFKKGAASFYIVAFSTLILVIVATSFAMVIISEAVRASNDDLSQSAYDSALAGVEDAKLAFANYQRCIEAGYTATAPNNDNIVTCGEIVYWMQNPDCDMVGHILGRIKEDESGEVVVSDTLSSANGDKTSDLNQAYTCVQIRTTLSDYRSNINSSNRIRIVRANFDGVKASNIVAVKLSWYSNREDSKNNYSNLIYKNNGSFGSDAGWRVVFEPASIKRVAMPPTLEVSMIQTAERFKLTDFDISVGNTTDRATMYFVPTNNVTAARNSAGTYIGAYNGSENVISNAQIVKTNDRKIKNLPFGVYCPENSSNEFACSVKMNLPSPVGGTRSDETFMFVLMLPYGQPDTDFAMEFLCAGGTTCSTISSTSEGVVSPNIATIKDSQVVIDSTGRANNLYRRVETRLESSDTSFSYPYYAIQILGGNSGSVSPLSKDMTVTSEYNF